MRQALTLCGALWICGLLWPASAFAGTPLDIVEVRAPDINCIFDSDCRITVDDRVSAIPVPAASGDGRFQSRTAPIGEHGTVGEHLYPYEYRIDLRDVGALTAAVCVDRLEVPFGPVESVDYNDDGRVEQVFVVTRGGLGSVAPSAAEIDGGGVTFTFSSPICPGSRPGGGDSSFFFGLASRQPPETVEATVGYTAGSDHTLAARAPGTGREPTPDDSEPTLCEVGPFTLPIHPTTPACRCVRDRGARELHCAFPHRDFVAVWRFPFPVAPREPFRLGWTVVPHTRAGADVTLTVSSASGFQMLSSHDEQHPGTRRGPRSRASRSGELQAAGAWLNAPSRPGRDRLTIRLDIPTQTGRGEAETVEVELPVTIEE